MPEIELKQLKAWYQKPLPWIGIGLVGCLILLAMPHVVLAYHRWSGRRQLHRATDCYAKGNFKEAILNARGALACNPQDVEATRIMAKTAEAVAAPQAVEFRRQLDALKPGDAENLLSLANDCLKAGDAAAADQALKSIQPTDQNSARYHDLAASVAWSNRAAAAAESHWVEAVRLDPAGDDYRLKLATLQLNTRTPEVRAGALKILQELSEKPAQSLPALRVLLGDAATRGEADRARALADTLASNPQATFADKLTRLSALRALKDSRFSSLTTLRTVIDVELSASLEQMQAAAVSKPEQIYELLTWMNEHDLALLVPDWVATLPAEIVSKPPVCVPVADSYARGSNWRKLKETVENASWQQIEFLRLAYLSRSLERLGDSSGAGNAWKKSLAAAEPRPEQLEMLGKEVLKWGWESKAEEALRKLSVSEQCPRWAIDYLWKASLEKGDSAQLYKTSKLILKAEPKNVRVRNNYLSLALLTGQDARATWQMAEALHKEHPADASVASTYGLALYQQGNAEAAVALLGAFPPEQLRAPSIALYYGIFLAATGQSQPAEEYLRVGAAAPQLPEEKALGDFFRSAVQSRAFDQRGDVSVADASWRDAMVAAKARPDWLEMLGRMALQWGWPQRAEEAVLKLSAAERCPRWAADTLWTASLKTGDSAQLYKASKLIVATHPQNIEARSNFIALSLLTRHDGDSPQQLAGTFHKENPGNPAGRLIYGLSLVQQDKAREAVAMMAALKPEQLHDPRAAFYYGLFLAAAGEADQAAESLQFVTVGLPFPEENALLGMLRAALQMRAFDQTRDTKDAGLAWNQVLTVAKARPDWLEILGRTMLAWGSPQRAEEALWKLSDDAGCPPWAIDFLWNAAEKGRDSAQLYKASKLRLKADPNNLAARNSFIHLSLLTDHATDFPHRLAEALYSDNPASVEATTTYALSLHLRGREKEAITLLATLKPQQLREPRVAFYYGIFLAAAGQPATAEEYLRLGAKVPLLPEEEVMLVKAKLAVQVGAAR